MQLPSLDVPDRVRCGPNADAAVVSFLEAARSGVVSRLEVHQDLPELVGAVDSNGWSALHYAASRDHVSALKWLLDAGAPINAKTSRTAAYTALAIAAHKGFSACVSLLLSHEDCNPLALDGAKLTPLHHAAASGSVETARALLAGGASLTRAVAIQNRDHSAPVSIAARSAATATGNRQGQSAAVLKLFEGESKRLKRWFRAARLCAMDTLTEMLDERPDTVNLEDASASTALISACRCARGTGQPPNMVD